MVGGAGVLKLKRRVSIDHGKKKALIQSMKESLG